MKKIKVAVYESSVSNIRNKPQMKSLADGIQAVGDELIYVSKQQIVDCDVAMIFSTQKFDNPTSAILKYRKNIFDHQKSKNKKIVVLESGLIKRGSLLDIKDEQYWRLGYNGLHRGVADFNNSNSPSNRYDLLNYSMQPWKKGGKNILVCMQVADDQSVYPLLKNNSSMIEWCKQIVLEIRKYTKRPIVIRPTPSKPQIPNIKDVQVSNNSLMDDFDDAWAVVTYNSGTAIEAIWNGIASFACHEWSLAWDMSLSDLSRIETPVYLDRTQWAYDICYAQWNMIEMRQGLAWQHLRKVFD